MISLTKIVQFRMACNLEVMLLVYLIGIKKGSILGFSVFFNVLNDFSTTVGDSMNFEKA